MTTTTPANPATPADPADEPTDAGPAVRLRSPGEICQAVPYLVGFVPEDSVVLVGMHRKRVVVTARLDLPPAAASEGEALATYLGPLLANLGRAGADRAVLVAYVREPAQDDVVGGVRAVVERLGVPLVEALRVCDGRWTSYTCAARCCPPEGTPVVDAARSPSPAVTRFAYEGRGVLAGRATLVEQVAAVGGLLRAAMVDRLVHELDAFVDAHPWPDVERAEVEDRLEDLTGEDALEDDLDDIDPDDLDGIAWGGDGYLETCDGRCGSDGAAGRDDGGQDRSHGYDPECLCASCDAWDAVLAATILDAAAKAEEALPAEAPGTADEPAPPVVSGAAEAYDDETVALARSWITRCADGATVDVDPAARIIAGLLAKPARDRLLAGWALDPVHGAPPRDALELWRQLASRAVLPGTAAPVATLLAQCAYLDHGDGALANVAVERALDDDPGYLLAHYVRTVLMGGIPPSTLRSWIGQRG